MLQNYNCQKIKSIRKISDMKWIRRVLFLDIGTSKNLCTTLKKRFAPPSYVWLFVHILAILQYFMCLLSEKLKKLIQFYYIDHFVGLSSILSLCMCVCVWFCFNPIRLFLFSFTWARFLSEFRSEPVDIFQYSTHR